MRVPQEIQASPAMLREVKLFARFDESELADLIQLGSTKAYEAHSNIVIEGETSWGIFLILDGYVGIFKRNKMTGDVHDVAQLHTGNFFGEMSLIDDNPRSASVRALTPCQILSISKEAFQTWLAKSSQRQLRFYEDCVKHLVNRIRDLDESYVISQYQLWRSVLKSKKTKEAA
jgi:CRP-like cAMP-binding protein